jgi:hypothetical protein
MLEAGPAVLEREPEPIRGGARGDNERRIVALAQIDDARVVREVHRQQLRMPVDPETADHQPVEVAREEVGQPERAGLGIGHRREPLGPREHLVAVRAREALDAFVGQHRIEQATGAAVRVGHEDAAVAVGASALDPASDGVRDPLGPVVEVRREAGHVEAWNRLDDREQLAGERAAADDEGPAGTATGPARRPMIVVGELDESGRIAAERPLGGEAVRVSNGAAADWPGGRPLRLGSDAIATARLEARRSRPATQASSAVRA